MPGVTGTTGSGVFGSVNGGSAALPGNAASLGGGVPGDPNVITSGLDSGGGIGDLVSNIPTSNPLNLFSGGIPAADIFGTGVTGVGNGFGGGALGGNAVGSNAAAGTTTSSLAAFAGPAIALAAIKFGWDRHVARGDIGRANASVNLAQLSEGKREPGAVPQDAIQGEIDSIKAELRSQGIPQAQATEMNKVIARLEDAKSGGMVRFKDALSGKAFYGLATLGTEEAGAIEFVWDPRQNAFGGLDGNNPFFTRAQQAENSKQQRRSNDLEKGINTLPTETRENSPGAFRRGSLDESEDTLANFRN